MFAGFPRVTTSALPAVELFGSAVDAPVLNVPRRASRPGMPGDIQPVVKKLIGGLYLPGTKVPFPPKSVKSVPGSRICGRVSWGKEGRH